MSDLNLYPFITSLLGTLNFKFSISSFFIFFPLNNEFVISLELSTYWILWGIKTGGNKFITDYTINAKDSQSIALSALKACPIASSYCPRRFSSTILTDESKLEVCLKLNMVIFPSVTPFWWKESIKLYISVRKFMMSCRFCVIAYWLQAS